MQRLVEELEAGTIPIGAVKANKAGEGATVTGTLTVKPSAAYTANQLPVAGAGQVKVEGGYSGLSGAAAYAQQLGLTVNRGAFITGPIVQSTGVSYTRNTYNGGGTAVNEFNARQHVFGSASTGLADASSTIVRIRGDLIVDGSSAFASNEIVESLTIEGGPGFSERLFIIYDGTGGTGKDIMDVWTDTSQNVNTDRGTYGDDTYRYDLGFAIDGNPTPPGVDPSDGATQVTGHTRNLRGVTVTSRGLGGVMDIDYKRTELELSGIALDVYGITSVNPGPTYDGTDKAPPRIDISGANGGINFFIDGYNNAYINTDGSASFVSVDASSADISGGGLLVTRHGGLDALEVDGSIHIDSGSGATIIPFAGSAGTVVIDASAEIRGDISGNRDLRLAGNASIDGSLTVLGETYVDGGFVINGDLSLNSGLKVQDLSRFYSNIVVDGSARILDKLILGGDASFNGALDVAGNSTLGGTLGLTGAATFGSTLEVDDDASMNAALKVGGDSILNGALTLTGDASLNSDLHVVGDASMNTLRITETNAGAFGLEVLGSKAQFNKSVSVFDSSSNFTSISGGSITSAGADWHAVRASGLALRVTGDSSFNGDVVVTGDSSVDGTSQVRGGALDPSSIFAPVALGVSGGVYFSDLSGGNHTDLSSNSQLFWIGDLPSHGAFGAYTVEWIDSGTGIGYLAKKSSSRRFKSNIQTVDVNYASNMYNVDARSYSDALGNGRSIGFIAEEINDAGMREFVIFDSQGQPEGVSYAEMVAPLLTLVKDQKARIEKLESDVAYLLQKAGGR
jgi:cytoskeletal protein CcmA (bactofilin family)